MRQFVINIMYIPVHIHTHIMYLLVCFYNPFLYDTFRITGTYPYLITTQHNMYIFYTISESPSKKKKDEGKK